MSIPLISEEAVPMKVLGLSWIPFGNAMITGITTSPNFPTTPGALRSVISELSPDAFVAKLNADGTALIYSTFLGGVDGFNFGRSVATDGSGNAYVTGNTIASDFPTTPGAFQTVKPSPPGFSSCRSIV
ncbi:SBBP repeat-containing protein [Paenibacillus sp. FSL W7-1332]|uniref:SBBP repeat-containing protein n=2 Tax=Paenibacillus TaxID=44249 RepID=UPI0030D627AF